MRTVLGRGLLAAVLTALLVLTKQLLTKVRLSRKLSRKLLLAGHGLTLEKVSLVLLERQLLSHVVLDSVLLVGLVWVLATGVTPSTAPAWWLGSKPLLCFIETRLLTLIPIASHLARVVSSSIVEASLIVLPAIAIGRWILMLLIHVIATLVIVGIM